jgi:putative membrane protein
MVALAATTVRAQQTTAAPRGAVNDNLFAQAATEGALCELTIAELGMQKATDRELKDFSKRMLDEHTKINNELATLAARKRVPLPTRLDSKSQFFAQSLAGLSGEEFDRCYAKAQWMAHMGAVAAFEAEAERGQDPDIKAFASRHLSHMKDHLKTIKPIAHKFMKDEEKEGGRTETTTEK